jgi:hypothetical protein
MILGIAFLIILLCIAWTKALSIILRVYQMTKKKAANENQTKCASPGSTGTTEESIDTGTTNSRDIPRPMDIILGRGKGNTKNPGNILFQGKNDRSKNVYLLQFEFCAPPSNHRLLTLFIF